MSALFASIQWIDRAGGVLEREGRESSPIEMATSFWQGEPAQRVFKRMPAVDVRGTFWALFSKLLAKCSAVHRRSATAFHASQHSINGCFLFALARFLSLRTLYFLGRTF